MTADELGMYSNLADRWMSRRPPFDGIAYVRDSLCGVTAAINCIDLIIPTLSGWGTETAIIGDDYFMDGDAYYPIMRVRTQEIASMMKQSPELRESLSGVSPGCSVSILAEDFGWLLRLHGYEPEETTPDAEVDVTLFVSRENLRRLDSLETMVGQDLASWRCGQPGDPPGVK